MARVARLHRIRAIPGQVARFVAFVTRLRAHPVHPAGFGARPRYVARLVAVVARRGVGALLAVFRKVPLPVAPVAPLGVLLAVTRKVPQSVALVALLPAAGERVAIAGIAASRLGALAGKVARPAAFVTHC